MASQPKLCKAQLKGTKQLPSLTLELWGFVQHVVGQADIIVNRRTHPCVHAHAHTLSSHLESTDITKGQVGNPQRGTVRTVTWPSTMGMWLAG